MCQSGLPGFIWSGSKTKIDPFHSLKHNEKLYGGLESQRKKSGVKRAKHSDPYQIARENL
jgi:hypothetical protein